MFESLNIEAATAFTRSGYQTIWLVEFYDYQTVLVQNAKIYAP